MPFPPPAKQFSGRLAIHPSIHSYTHLRMQLCWEVLPQVNDDDRLQAGVSLEQTHVRGGAYPKPVTP